MSSLHLSLSSPHPSLSSSRLLLRHPRVGEDPLSSCRGTLLTNLSLDVYLPSRTESFRSTVLSGSTHLGQKTSGGSGLRIFAGAKIYYRSDLLLLAETLVTVSPCEFPPRCLPRILPCHPRLGRGSPLFPRISQPLHLAFPKILYRLQTNNLLEKKDWT